MQNDNDDMCIAEINDPTKVIYKFTKGCFSPSLYKSAILNGEKAVTLNMFLQEAPKAKKYGYQQPRTYLKVGSSNTSSFVCDPDYTHPSSSSSI
jgi:hypothetical protein